MRLPATKLEEVFIKVGMPEKEAVKRFTHLSPGESGVCRRKGTVR